MRKRVLVTALVAVLLVMVWPVNVFAAEGWQKIDGKWYYLDEGVRASSCWIEDEGRWYYLDSEGAMLHGWHHIGENWYYFGWPDQPDTGAMRHGWFREDDRWYYLGKPDDENTGAMRKGWANINGNWYYFGWSEDPDSGAMRHGWFKDNDRWYYLGKPDDEETGEAMGKMYENPQTSPIRSELQKDGIVTRSKAGYAAFGGVFRATGDAGIVYDGDNPYLIVVLTNADSKLAYVKRIVVALEEAHKEMI